MGIISRLYNFVDGTPAVADQVDNELNQIIATINALSKENLAAKSVTEKQLFPQNGLVVGTQGVTLDGPTNSSWADWPAGSVTFTPEVAVYMIAALEVHGQMATPGGVENITVDFSIAVDGAAEETRFAKLHTERADEGGYGAAMMLYRLALTAAAHTVKIRYRRTSLPSGVGQVTGAGAELLWLLVAQ